MVSDSAPGDRANAIAADVGLAADWNVVSASAAYRNVGGALRTGMAGGAPDEALPADLRGGLAFHWRQSAITMAAEASQITGLKSQLAAGIEWWPAAVLGVRGGVADLTDAAGRFSAGS